MNSQIAKKQILLILIFWTPIIIFSKNFIRSQGLKPILHGKLFTCQDYQEKELTRFCHVDGLFLCVKCVDDHSHDPKKNIIKKTEDKIKLKIQKVFDTFQTKT